MITKLTALALSGILTVGLIAAAAPEVETKQQTAIKADNMVNACRQAYIEYRTSRNKFNLDQSMKLSAEEALNSALIKFPKEQRGVVALICLGYGEGYEDGVRGTV